MDIAQLVYSARSASLGPSSVTVRARGLAGGALIDAILGDPPNVAHPVAAIGHAAAVLRRFAPGGAAARRGYGFGATLALAAGAMAAARCVEVMWPRRLGRSAVAAPALIALASSRRTLLRRAREVGDALDAGDLDAARRLLSYHLVSRDTSDLDASEVAAAAIESVAENLHDSAIGPWCWAAVGGAPAAWGYRAVNTLDALWGYREPFLEELGMGAARLDDVLNLAPARIAAAAIVASASVHGGDARAAWRMWRRDAARTPSPNAGHPMAAMAGALGVVLNKRGVYTLGTGGRPADTADLRRACRIADTAAWLAATVLVAALLERGRR